MVHPFVKAKICWKHNFSNLPTYWTWVNFRSTVQWVDALFTSAIWEATYCGIVDATMAETRPQPRPVRNWVVRFMDQRLETLHKHIYKHNTKYVVMTILIQSELSMTFPQVNKWVSKTEAACFGGKPRTTRPAPRPPCVKCEWLRDVCIDSWQSDNAASLTNLFIDLSRQSHRNSKERISADCAKEHLLP